MRAVTEFWSITLAKGQQAKQALVDAGKNAEEILAGLGETFKLEGEKLKHFAHAIEVAWQNPEKLTRILVVALNEGEKAPHKAVEAEGHHYVPEFAKEPKAIQKEKIQMKAPGRDNKGKDKGSIYGATPEELAKKEAAKKAAQQRDKVTK